MIINCVLVANLYPWIPADVPKARAFMQYNLAVCYATRGEFDKAMATLALVSHLPSHKALKNSI